jgi:hypothetical protein
MTDMTETALSALSHAISAVVERTAGHIVLGQGRRAIEGGVATCARLRGSAEGWINQRETLPEKFAWTL